MPRTSALTVPTVVAWRLLIAACALIGFVQTCEWYLPNLAYLTEQSNLVTGVSFLGLAVLALAAAGRGEGRAEGRGEGGGAGWLRGALTVLMLLVGGTYLTILDGPLERTGDVLTHVVTPALVLLDWVVVTRGQHRLRWWYAPTWLALPLAYLGFYLAYGRRLYFFLDPHDDGFWIVVVEFLVGLLLVGYLVAGVAVLRAVLRARLRPARGPGVYDGEQPAQEH